MTDLLGYLAAPYSNDDKHVRLARFHAINRAAGHLMASGLYIFSPISHGHSIAEDYPLPTGFDYWRRYDAIMLGACDYLIVLTLAGWQKSVGVTSEREMMIELKRPIFYANDESRESLLAVKRAVTQFFEM